MSVEPTFPTQTVQGSVSNRKSPRSRLFTSSRGKGLLTLGLLAFVCSFGAAFLTFMAAPEAIFDDYYTAKANLQLLLERGQGSMERSKSRQFAGYAAAALEDERIFERTVPIDLRSIARATLHNLRAGRIVEGGSTIPLQLAKASLPAKARLERTWARKLLELRLVLTEDIVSASSKDLLGAYIENIDCGIQGARGLDACALYLFSHPAYALSANEVLFLAAAMRAPGRALQAPESVKPRMDHALKKMSTLGWILPEQAQVLLTEPIPQPHRNIALLSSLQRGRPLQEAQVAHEAWTAALSAAKSKLPGLEDDISVAVALYADGNLLSLAGAHESLLQRPVEPGSWMKVFCGKGIYDIAGRDYLVETQVPLDVPMWDRNGRPYAPGNVGKNLPSHAPPILYLARSTNTGVLAAVAYLPVFLPPGTLRSQMSSIHLPDNAERHLWNSTTHLHAVAEAYSGLSLPPGSLEDDLGYGQTAAWARQLCYQSLKRYVPSASVAHDDWSTLLGSGVAAPLTEWATGFKEIMYPAGQQSDFGQIMALYGIDGTMAHHLLGQNVGPFPYKTHSTQRSAGLMMAFKVPGDKRTFVLQVYAHRPSGKAFPKRSVYGSTVGGPAWKALRASLFESPDNTLKTKEF